jgi:anoctamin-10
MRDHSNSTWYVIRMFHANRTNFRQEYLPTIALAVSLPYISSRFEAVAAFLTEYENHRTQDRHEMALTQKIFVVSSITKYLPILLTAFIYVPCGDMVVERVDSIFDSVISNFHVYMSAKTFNVDAKRLRNEVVALVVTEQILGFGEELILPILKRKATQWYGERKLRRSHTSNLLDTQSRASTIAKLPRQARKEAELDHYNVQDDIQEMVVQFGYLALFSPVWPLISVGFLINNWIELRSDFLKICIEHQRPAPIRADSIGPWLASLEFLNWLGSISTAAIVYLFRNGSDGQGRGYDKQNLYALAAIVFVSEHIYLMVRAIVRLALQRLGSDAEKRAAREESARRKALMDQSAKNRPIKIEDEKVDVADSSDDEDIWQYSKDYDHSLLTGIDLIKSSRPADEVYKKA